MALMYIEEKATGRSFLRDINLINGKGRVVSITPTKVVVLWAGTKMELGMDAAEKD